MPKGPPPDLELMDSKVPPASLLKESPSQYGKYKFSERMVVQVSWGITVTTPALKTQNALPCCSPFLAAQGILFPTPSRETVSSPN